MNNKLNEIVDDKGSINAALFGLAELKEFGFKPSKKIRIIFGCDEESGSEDMEYYTWSDCWLYSNRNHA